METSELIAAFLATVLTIMVLTYLIGDNPLFKIAMHLLIGVSAGYAGAIAIRNVLWPGLIDPILDAIEVAGLTSLLDPELIVTVIVPWVLVLLLFLKVAPSTARYGTVSMALLVGVGAAVVVGGAITGAIVPLTLASMNPLGGTSVPSGAAGLERFLDVFIVLIGTLSALFYFQFSVRRGEGEAPFAVISGVSVPGPLAIFKGIGKGFIAVTFGVMYAGAVAATLVVLGERVQFMWNTLSGLITTLG